MAYIIWGLLNISLFIGVIIFGYKTAKQIREKIGWVVAFLFVCGLLSMISGSKPDEDNLEPGTRQVKTWHFFPVDSLDKSARYLMSVDFKKTPISKYTLFIQYGRSRQFNMIPSSASTDVSGYIFGTRWTPLNVIINGTGSDNKFEYEIHGVIKWTLLNIPVYQQFSTWTGVVELKQQPM